MTLHEERIARMVKELMDLRSDLDALCRASEVKAGFSEAQPLRTLGGEVLTIEKRLTDVSRLLKVHFDVGEV